MNLLEAPRRRRRSKVWLVVVTVAVAACSTPEPTRQEWRATWEDAQAAVPAMADLPDPPDEQLCQDVLGQLREVRDELTPAPDPVIGSAAEAWIASAESLFFECFDRGRPGDRVAAGYELLDRLRAEVEAALGGATEASEPG